MSESDFKIHGVTVCGNERHRYLEASLSHHSALLDSLFVYDDQSTDGSLEVSREYAEVVVRPDDVPTFLKHESEFRQAGWNAWEERVRPKLGDWVLAFDTDEFWYGPPLKTLVGDYTGGIVRRPEMWTYLSALHRVDGQWSQIFNVRFFPYRPGGLFVKRELAGGSAPTYASQLVRPVDGHLLHYGYADPRDRTERHNRYLNRPGHSKSHIRSITGQSAVLDIYEPQWGKMPIVWRGVATSNVDSIR